MCFLLSCICLYWYVFIYLSYFILTFGKKFVKNVSVMDWLYTHGNSFDMRDGKTPASLLFLFGTVSRVKRCRKISNGIDKEEDIAIAISMATVFGMDVSFAVTLAGLRLPLRQCRIVDWLWLFYSHTELIE